MEAVLLKAFAPTHQTDPEARLYEWGCVEEVESIEVVPEMEGMVFCTFKSYPEAPVSGIKKISKQFPNAIIEMSYRSFKNNSVGAIVMKNGIAVSLLGDELTEIYDLVIQARIELNEIEKLTALKTQIIARH